MANNTPVLLIVFNRPDTTLKVFATIKKAKPQKLYIAVDAPRMGNIEDEKNCPLVNEIVKQVDWVCETHYRFAETNQGCGPGPFNAISWAFKNEDRLIILEDDCVPAQPFFKYCEELLDRYKNDTRIWLISGDQYNEEAVKTPHSYFFSRYGHSQGWATWRRCWPDFDDNYFIKKWPLMKQQDIFKALFPSKEEISFFEKMYDCAYSDISLNKNSWDIQLSFYFRANNALSIVPAKHLVSNIGYVGTHSNKKLWFHDLPVDESYEIRSHPDFILPDVNYDAWHFKHHWNRQSPISLIKKINKMIRRTIKWIVKI